MLAELERRAARLWRTAADLGLDPYPVEFEVVPAHILYEFGAYGLPGRFGHWTRGKAYHRLKVQYDLGLHRIYEMVINADPAEAFLLDKNTLLENTFVVAHVLGHADFFRHNGHFTGTAAGVPKVATARAERIRRYEEALGTAAVEETLDHLLALEANVAPWAGGEPQPEDVLGHLIRRAPLADWQRDLAEIVRDEALYFAPQMRTKIANEGWAAFWHLRLLRALELTDGEVVDFARLHAAVTGPGGILPNPYRVGLALWEAVVAREGLDEAFLLRETCDDLTLVRGYLDERLVRELELFVFSVREDGLEVSAVDAEAVRRAYLRMLENGGRPVVRVVGESEGGRLLLEHSYDGRPLDERYTEETLRHVALLWGAPVEIRSVRDGKRVTYGHDGRTATKRID